MSYSAAEWSAGHRDQRERAELRVDLEVEATSRCMPETVLHTILGLEQGSLHDGTLSTDVLRAALEHLRRQPL